MNFGQENKHHSSLRLEISLAFVLLAIIPIFFLSILFYVKINAYFSKQISEYFDDICVQTAEKYDYIFDQTVLIKNQLSAEILNNEDFFEQDLTMSKERLFFLKFMRDSLAVKTNLFTFISDIHVVLPEVTVYSSDTNLNPAKLLKKEWFAEPEKIDEIIINVHDVDYIYRAQSNAKVISYLKKVRSFYNFEQILFIQIDIKYDFIHSILEQTVANTDGIYILHDTNGFVIASSYSKEFEPLFKQIPINEMRAADIELLIKKGNDREFIKSSFAVQDGDFIIKGYTQRNNLNFESSLQKIFPISIIVIGILYVSLISLILSRRITKPFNTILDVVRQISRGDLEVRIPDLKFDEVQKIAVNINSMLDEINNLMKKIIRQENEVNTARLNALEAQINPHFLYNTLEVVRGIASVYNADEIIEISASLADLYRYSIDPVSHFVSLEEEVTILKKYILIQKYRFGERINVKFTISDDIYKCKIIRLLLQPLIENSVIHGIETRLDPGTINISAERRNDLLIICIKDDGVGIESQKLIKLQKELLVAPESIKGDQHIGLGVGLLNVNYRIKLYFGNEYGMSIESEEDYGTKIVIKLPYWESAMGDLD